MDNDKTSRKFESVFSTKVRAGKRRTYFFDVRKTKGDDFFITLTESTRKFNDQGYERHKIFLYKEDFNRFVASLEETVNYVKTELMPDYDYEEFTRRNEEYEKRRAEEDAAALAAGPVTESVAEGIEVATETATEEVAEQVTKEVTEEVTEATTEVVEEVSEVTEIADTPSENTAETPESESDKPTEDVIDDDMSW